MSPLPTRAIGRPAPTRIRDPASVSRVEMGKCRAHDLRRTAT
jgi:hypothetical protein